MKVISAQLGARKGLTASSSQRRVDYLPGLSILLLIHPSAKVHQIERGEQLTLGPTLPDCFPDLPDRGLIPNSPPSPLSRYQQELYEQWLSVSYLI
jgi:hypothetical protein